MKIKTLFAAYEKLIRETLNIEKIFTDSGVTKGTKTLDFGFFPYGSGILTDKSKIDEAEIKDCKIMVLGNDFGTESYISEKCSGNREKDSNPTIKNLVSPDGLGLNVKSTFFTNLHVGLRIVEKNVSKEEKATNIKRVIKIQKEYSDFCFAFFKIQLEMINPQIVLCLGKEVQKSLKEYSTIFKGLSFNNYELTTNEAPFGNRKFILIPHPSMANSNWGKMKIKDKMKNVLAF